MRILGIILFALLSAHAIGLSMERQISKEELLMALIKKGATQEIKRFLDQEKMSVNFSWENQTPLCAAVEQGKAEMVGLLLQAGAHVNNENYASLLMVALLGNSECLDLILKKRSAIYISEKMFALLIAAEKGRSDIMRKLIEPEMEPNALIMLRIFSIILQQANSEGLKILLNAGMNANSADKLILDGLSPLPFMLKKLKEIKQKMVLIMPPLESCPTAQGVLLLLKYGATVKKEDFTMLSEFASYLRLDPVELEILNPWLTGWGMDEVHSKILANPLLLLQTSLLTYSLGDPLRLSYVEIYIGLILSSMKGHEHEIVRILSDALLVTQAVCNGYQPGYIPRKYLEVKHSLEEAIKKVKDEIQRCYVEPLEQLQINETAHNYIQRLPPEIFSSLLSFAQGHS